MTRWKNGPIPTIGIVGGIGSGKSAVAHILADLGCEVIDSDAEAKAALLRPDVISTLRSWWGDAVLDPAGAIDRRAVARIVFQDPAQRSRLEALVHPIIAQRRQERIAQAIAAGKTGIVIDAPLLYEAGVDAECDVVLFVDAPPQLRENRVRQNRGWDRHEWQRRENAQWPLDVKRDRADDLVENSGDFDALARQVARVFNSITTKHNG